MEKSHFYLIGITLGIGCLLLVILVPMSFSSLEYYEMGFVMSKTSGKVDTSKVYFGGRHATAVTETFKKFQADVHMEDFKDFTVFTAEKLEISLQCSVQYVLRPEDLEHLFDTFDVTYKGIFRSSLQSAIKGAANNYTVDDFRLNRAKVAEGLELAAAKTIGGSCCRKGANKPGCIEYSLCALSDKGLFGELQNFQLQSIYVSSTISTRFLRKVLEKELEDTEDFIQQEKVARKGTEEKRKQKENLANEIIQSGKTNSTLIKAKAIAEAKALVDDARNKGLNIIYSALNITSDEHKKTLDYIRTLSNAEKAHMYVDFQYMVANGKP